MKSFIEDYGHVVVQLTAKDVAKVIDTFQASSHEDEWVMAQSVLKLLHGMSFDNRQKFVDKALASHLMPKPLKEVRALLASYDNGMWE